jgi:hypothetical protein
MPARPDRPGADEPGQPADGGLARGSQDELRRRLANLPASHPSSPWYREGRRAGAERPAGPGSGPPDESGAEVPEQPRRARSEESWRGGRPDRDPGRPHEMTGGAAAAAAARAARGRDARVPEQERRRADDALWAQAARWQAAADARRQGRGAGAPSPTQARREPYRPWFADSAGEETWLTGEGTGEPWFTRDGEGER